MTMARAHIRLYGDLSELAGEVEVAVPIAAPRSVKDAVESCGVPHPEVGLLVVDSRPVGFDHRLEGGERVAVFPPFRSIEVAAITTVEPAPVAPRFVLDVHLGTLTRRLRVLGFDCWYRTEVDDDQLAEVAVAEERILLTRDRGLLMRRVISHGYCPRSDDPDTQALEIVRRYRLCTQLAPWTRCVRCNGRLERVARQEVLDELPPRTRTAYDTFARCTSCRQVYWPGSHVEAMRGFLTRIEACCAPTTIC
ncbi:MAG: Mut7-C RNAse domain-containing protein [Nitriliruptoraceae bacterium]